MKMINIQPLWSVEGILDFSLPSLSLTLFPQWFLECFATTRKTPLLFDKGLRDEDGHTVKNIVKLTSAPDQIRSKHDQSFWPKKKHFVRLVPTNYRWIATWLFSDSRCVPVHRSISLYRRSIWPNVPLPIQSVCQFHDVLNSSWKM